MLARWKHGGALALCLSIAVAGAAAQEGDNGDQPGPKYFNLRYDEDFSYLDGDAGSYQADFFDPIKNIHVTLTISHHRKAKSP